jgi:hypothetical protein
MTDTVVDALIVDLLVWLEGGERTYEEVIDVWRTSCPKLTVWEDAKDRGLVATESFNGRELVRITPAGFVFLHEQRNPPKSAERPEAPAPPDFPH